MVGGFVSGGKRLRGGNRGMEFLIVCEGGLDIFQLLLGYPGVFFS